MSTKDVVRAWKDESYRSSLSAEELADLPQHPAGAIELSQAELQGIVGGVQNPTTDIARCAVTFISPTGCALSYIFYCL